MKVVRTETSLPDALGCHSVILQASAASNSIVAEAVFEHGFGLVASSFRQFGAPRTSRKFLRKLKADREFFDIDLGYLSHSLAMAIVERPLPNSLNIFQTVNWEQLVGKLPRYTSMPSVVERLRKVDSDDFFENISPQQFDSLLLETEFLAAEFVDIDKWDVQSVDTRTTIDGFSEAIERRRNWWSRQFTVSTEIVKSILAPEQDTWPLFATAARALTRDVQIDQIPIMNEIVDWSVAKSTRPKIR